MTQVIGIDIGGTSVKGIVTDKLGKLLTWHRVPTEAARGRNAILDSIDALIIRLRGSYPEAKAIGIGSAGRINVDSGEVVYATDNLPGWQGTNLIEWAKQRFGLPVAVDNDANTALLGEAWLGAGQNYNHLIMLTLGTGVGGANMVGGRLFRGAHWNGGEWGHSVLFPGGNQCNCGRRGCVEQYLSGTSLVKMAKEIVQKDYHNGLEIMNDVISGNDLAKRALSQYIEHLAIFIGSLQEGYDPQAFIIGGGIIDSKSVWWHWLEQQLEVSGSAAQVRAAQLGNNAGSFGAARLALQLLP